MNLMRQITAAVLPALGLAACAHRGPPPADQVYVGNRCAPFTACAPRQASPLRQYWDVSHRRYYYYDPATFKYYWENGAPKS
jgi:hypothetical protein